MTMRSKDSSAAVASALDKSDSLAPLRRQFAFPRHHDSAAIYLCGHSLGLMPKRVPKAVGHELDVWANSAVHGHFSAAGGWFDYHKRLTPQLAKLAGARQAEVVAMNSLTVNMHLLLASFFRPQGRRSKIVLEAGAFPSDRYAAVSQLQHHGLDPTVNLLELEPQDPNVGLTAEDLDACLQRNANDVAVVWLPGVQYLSGQVLDIRALTRVAHQHGALIGFDLAHAIGNIPLRLHTWEVDIAVWCGYKYLNGGPGAIGGCFVHDKHGNQALPRLAGWWGHDESRRFLMEPDFRPIPGAQGWQLSNPPILAMVALRVALDLHMRAGIHNLHKKSTRLSAFLQSALETQCGKSVQIITPDKPALRGAQLSLQLSGQSVSAQHVAEALEQLGVIVDTREPNIIRMAAAPIYNSFKDVHGAVTALKKVLG